MFGLLNIDKAAGCTSRDVVNRVQRLVRPHRVGHAGTLDPLATGVLVIAIGPATRLVEYVQQMPKTYQGTFLLGRVSDTEDIEGTIAELPGATVPSRDEILSTIPRFIGSIDQRPPAYSALKIAGQPAYKLARRGKQPELKSRPVEIHSIELVRYEYPELELLVRCGSGTYLRSLGRDVAESLKTGAVMSQLRRLAIGPFTVDEAARYEDLTADMVRANLLPASMAVAHLPRIQLNEEAILRIKQGQSIAGANELSANEVAAVDRDDQLVAILTPTKERRLRPTKCLIDRQFGREQFEIT